MLVWLVMPIYELRVLGLPALGVRPLGCASHRIGRGSTGHAEAWTPKPDGRAVGTISTSSQIFSLSSGFGGKKFGTEWNPSLPRFAAGHETFNFRSAVRHDMFIASLPNKPRKARRGGMVTERDRGPSGFSTFGISPERFSSGGGSSIPV